MLSLLLPLGTLLDNNFSPLILLLEANLSTFEKCFTLGNFRISSAPPPTAWWQFHYNILFKVLVTPLKQVIY
ncbi:hypothetical protein [Fulvivirga sediminis]|uniref:Uncharacterized protein n=1 Tax=Fulvivirga sediminis TaxID=2803949 RepID=A0A937FCZ8_9BACT|nr:hypothetical protein [Fulvivirga sediminis]MBL3658273.1 hypothetical protein [Fulvivirga sediminis]